MFKKLFLLIALGSFYTQAQAMDSWDCCNVITLLTQSLYGEELSLAREVREGNFKFKKSETLRLLLERFSEDEANEMIRFKRDNNLPVDGVDKYGYTALSYALQDQDGNAVKALLLEGADLDNIKPDIVQHLGLRDSDYCSSCIVRDTGPVSSVGIYFCGAMQALKNYDVIERCAQMYKKNMRLFDHMIWVAPQDVVYGYEPYGYIADDYPDRGTAKLYLKTIFVGMMVLHDLETLQWYAPFMVRDATKLALLKEAVQTFACFAYRAKLYGLIAGGQLRNILYTMVYTPQLPDIAWGFR